MKKISTIVLAALLVSANLSARTITGVVKGAGEVLPGVLVTDGFSFSPTDTKGAYTIDLADKAEFVYLVTPKGYVADYSLGVPQFYQRLQADKNVYNFNLQRMKGEADHYVMITMSDPQLDVDTDADKLFAEALPDIQETASRYPNTQVAGIVLGDISWDVYSHNAIYKEFARKAGFPIYPVIGNHDFDKYMQPSDTADYAHYYKADFGPLYYAFQLGDAYYIVLNDMDYKGNKRYRTAIDMPDQMRWLETILRSAFNMGNRVYIAMHAPIKPSPESSFIPGGEHLMNILLNKFEAVIITGHHHHNTNKELGGGVLEHNIAALCGNWWTAPVSSDGAPRGYQVYEGKGRDFSWYFKATGFSPDYQFKLYQPGRVIDRPNAVVAKIWNWDNAWQTRWYQDGVYKGAMQQFYSYDPDYCEYVNGARVVDDYVPVRLPHYFSAVPDEGAKEIRVEVIDRFGKVYTQTIEL